MAPAANTVRKIINNMKFKIKHKVLNWIQARPSEERGSTEDSSPNV